MKIWLVSGNSYYHIIYKIQEILKMYQKIWLFTGNHHNIISFIKSKLWGLIL